MPLFTQTNFREGVSDDRDDRFRHLANVIVPGKAVARGPEMGGTGTSVVFMPYPDFENPEYKSKNLVLDDRLSDDPMDFSRWMFHAQGIIKFGVNPVTMLFDDPIDGEDGFIYSEHNPAQMIVDAAYRADKNDTVIETPFGTSASDNWGLLLNGGKDENGKEIFKSITRPQRVVLAYALVYSSGKTSYIAQHVPFGGAAGDLPVVFVMSQYTARESLCKAINQVVGEETNLRLKYPVVTGTRFVHFYDKQKNNCPALQAAAMAQPTQLGGIRRSFSGQLGAQTEKSGTEIGYGVHVTDTYSGRTGDAQIQRNVCAALACQRFQPWEEVVRGFKPKQAAKLIGDQAGLPWSLLYYAWKSTPEYYPEEMKERLRKIVSGEEVAPAKKSAGAAAAVPGLGIALGAGAPAIGNPADAASMFGLGPAAHSLTTIPGANGTPPDSAASAAQGGDPGAMPWGGHVSDPGRPDEAPPDSDATSAYDSQLAAEAQKRLREFMAKGGHAAAPEAMRSASAKPPGK